MATSSLAPREQQPKRSGVWNKYDDMAAAGIFAAARAAGATGAGIQYGDVHYKVWFNKPQGDEPDEVMERIKALQLGDSRRAIGRTRAAQCKSIDSRAEREAEETEAESRKESSSSFAAAGTIATAGNIFEGEVIPAGATRRAELAAYAGRGDDGQ